MTRALLPMLVLLIGPLGDGVALAQTVENATRSRLTALLNAAPGTPDGKGLVTTALAEAHTALAQALLAAKAADDLAAMQAHARGVVHALNPAGIPSGPGLGYGLTRAVDEIVAQVQSTLAADQKADVKRTAARALGAAGNVQQWIDALMAAAQRVATARSVADASAANESLVPLARQIIAGLDRDGDGHVTFAAGEGGLLNLRLSLGVLLIDRAGVAPAPLREVTR
jgi:hypothetical protein